MGFGLCDVEPFYLVLIDKNTIVMLTDTGLF
jgi:hypothetical protein